MINQLHKTIRLVAHNQSKFDERQQNFKDFQKRKQKKSSENEEVEEPEDHKKPHWLWDNKWFILFKKLLIAFLLLKAVTLFWNEMAKLIKAAKNVELAFG
ncbi:MAG: hypothetical protein JNJ41_02440 [Bacteroidia bacterium]|nr:hypothetical protein [Bacteroidia bacterium]